MIGARMSACLVQLPTVALGFCIVASACGGSRGVTSTGAEARSVCLTENRPAERLLTDGNLSIYVEPMTIARSDQSVLLAGLPTFVWQRIGGSIQDKATGSALGAYRDASGRVSALPKPHLAGSITDIRVAAGQSGRYAAVFAQLQEPDNYSTFVDYWYSTTGGQVWDSLERLPPLAAGILSTNQATDLVRIGDSLLIAVPIRQQGRVDVAIYVRAKGRWSIDVVPTKHLAYLALSADESDGPLLAVVRPDTTLPSDWNSLSLFVREGQMWVDRGFVAHGGTEPIYEPRLVAASGIHILSWRARIVATKKQVARAVRVARGSLLGTITTLTPDIEGMVPVVGTASSPTWVVTTPPSETGPGRLQLVRLENGIPQMLYTGTNPFTGALLAFASSDEVNVVGPIEGQDPNQEPVVSALLRIDPRCGSAPVLRRPNGNPESRGFLNEGRDSR
jgi:hypothetical protein